MKPLPLGTMPYMHMATVGMGVVLLAALYLGLPPYLPGTRLFHPYDLMAVSLWLAFRVLALVEAWRRYRRWRHGPVWEVRV